MIDSHTHLHLLDDPDNAVAEAGNAGVNEIVTIGLDQDSWSTAIAATERYDKVYAAVGLHPNSAEQMSDAAWSELQQLAQHPRCVALGETGLDYYRDYASREAQHESFLAHIDLAKQLKKPLIIHTRAADDDSIATLTKNAGNLDVLLHCFSMPDRLEECCERGWWISFAGNITYPKSTALAQACERVPIDKLLIETDAPYLSPQPVRKFPNQPAYVVYTAQFIAERRGVTVAELSAAVSDNAARLFGW